MKGLIKIKEALHKNSYACAIGDDETIIYTSFEKGVKPLMKFYNSQIRCKNLYVADKIVGKGAAFLMILISTKAVYTPIISESALDILKKHDIEVEYDKVVPFVRNRTGEGRCPIESAVIDEDDPIMALDIIKEKLKQLSA